MILTLTIRGEYTVDAYVHVIHRMSIHNEIRFYSPRMVREFAPPSIHLRWLGLGLTMASIPMHCPFKIKK